jgi:hypothetical protein
MPPVAVGEVQPVSRMDDLVGAELVQIGQIFHRDPVIPCDRVERVSRPDDMMSLPRAAVMEARRELGLRERNPEIRSFPDRSGRAESVHRAEVLDADRELPRKSLERVASSNRITSDLDERILEVPLVSPAGHRRSEAFRNADRPAAGRYHTAMKMRVELTQLQSIDRHCVGEKGQRERSHHRDLVEIHLRWVGDREAVSLGGRRQDDRRIERWDVAASLAREGSGFEELPERGGAMLPQRAAHTAGTAVVRGEREWPVAEHPVQILQKRGCRDRRFPRIRPFIDPPVDPQTVLPPRRRHELPHPVRARAGSE